ncbi:hypothetical protein C8R43DRAFT_866576, partial [Mycena crocata]
SPLDLLLNATLEACVTPEQANTRLYGAVLKQSNPVSAYITTSMKGGHASFAVWWGDGNRKNCGHIVDGKSSNARACILAVLCAARDSARDSAPDKNLIIYTSSEYVIRSFCFWARDNETQGWSCANGEDISIAVGWLARRQAPTEFRWI